MSESICCELPTKWEECVNKIIEKENYTTYEIDKRHTSTNGGNFVGVLYEVDVKGETKDGKKEIHLFVKNITPNYEKALFFSIPDMYKTELFAYKDLFKLFEELQEVYNVPVEERYRTIKSYDESYSESLILENLSAKGYTTYDRMDVISLEFAELSMKAIAKFNAFGFVLQEKNPNYYKENISSRKFAMNDMSEFSRTATNTIMSVLDEDTMSRLNCVYKDFGEQFKSHVMAKTGVQTLCHGDYRPNNILTYFKDGEATEIIPIDYQLVYHGNPVMDLFYFIFICTDREFRKAHLSHLKDVYHETMTTFLKYFDMDINNVFPKKEFLKMFDEKLEVGLLVSLLSLPIIFVSSEDVPDIMGDMSSVSLITDERMKPRLQGAIDDYIEWGII